MKLGLIGGASVALPLGVWDLAGARIRAAEAVISPSVAPFGVDLPIPPVLAPSATEAAADHYVITQQEGMANILPGRQTPIWGYNGSFPGPTIVAQAGRTTNVHQINHLPVPVATHLHGGHTPPASDGYPMDLILPMQGSATIEHDHHGTVVQGEKLYTYPNQQPASMHWIHDHRMDFSGPQVYRGLAAFYLIHDPLEDALGLPASDHEVPLMIADRTFNKDGSFFYPAIDPTYMTTPGVLGKFSNGMLGDTILVNGAVQPRFAVDGARYRFRILNASNARVYRLALSTGEAFTQIGSDAGLLAAPQQLATLTISPAERFDVVIDFGQYPPGTQVILLNQLGTGRQAQVMRFDVVRTARDDSHIPAQLADFTLPESTHATPRTFQMFYGLGGWTINGHYFDPDRIDAAPKLGATEIWEVTSDNTHPFHPHLVHFHVLSRNGGPPLPEDAGRKDTVLLRAGEKVRLLMQFTDYRGKYVFHCHNLEHEDMRMMGQFQVS